VMNGSRSRYGQDVKGLGLSIARSVSPGAGEPRGGGLFTRLTAGLSGRKGGRG
jgi:hypothetical protein